MTDLVVAATFIDRAEALIARTARIRGLDLLGTMPHFTFAEGGCRVQVRTEDLEAARAILRDAQLAVDS